MWQYNQSSELMHFGVLGMQWGRRKSPAQIQRAATKSSRKSAEKQLNALDIQRAQLKKGSYEADSQRSDKLMTKYTKAIDRGNEKKMKKIEAKFDKNEAKLAGVRQALAENKIKTEKLIKDIQKSGMVVNSYDTTRSALTGKQMFGEIVFSTMLGLPANFQEKRGTEYTVTEQIKR